ncbi:hypothetical protein GALMADRAFT_147509 [Galerina marginata CBS 339.88]|uniref:Uncharacterized protein n=1 Tax=Galerina marginata (strain CBS 339.88) TaxID=685588 RepID=A0A067S7P8_GALM3|nr:hypothetical protein GALMADRAFT_147509 [Galerina marginata CBS 339.88]
MIAGGVDVEDDCGRLWEASKWKTIAETSTRKTIAKGVEAENDRGIRRRRQKTIAGGVDVEDDRGRRQTTPVSTSMPMRIAGVASTPASIAEGIKHIRW